MAWKCKESGDMTASFLRIISTFPTQRKHGYKAPQDFAGQKTVTKPPCPLDVLITHAAIQQFFGGEQEIIPLSPKVSNLPSWNVWPLLTLIHPKKDTQQQKKRPKGLEIRPKRWSWTMFPTIGFVMEAANKKEVKMQ